MTKEATTEVIMIPLLPGLDLDTGDAKEIWDSILSTIADQPGCQKVFYGRQVEHPDTLQGCINWDSLASHQAFEASPAYGPFMESVEKLIAGEPTLYHTTMPLTTPFAGPATAPTTELVSLYFELSYPQADFDASWAEFARLFNENAKGFHGCAGGWSIEEVEREDIEGGKARVFLAALGWDSVEAHMAFRETPTFKEAIPLLRGGAKAIEVHHVKFQSY